MRKFLSAFAVLSLAMLSSAAFAGSPLSSKELEVLKPVQSLIGNVKVSRASATTISLVGKDGSTLSAGNVGYVDVAGTTYVVNAPLTITVPNQSVFGGGSSAFDVFVYIGVKASTKAVTLCLSDKGGLTAKGSTATSNSGFVSCPNLTLASTDPIRAVAKVQYSSATNIAATVWSAAPLVDGTFALPVKFFGQASSVQTGTASLSFSVPGLASTNYCIVTPAALGTGPAYMVTAAAGSNVITGVFDANQTSGTTTISYVCF